MIKSLCGLRSVKVPLQRLGAGKIEESQERTLGLALTLFPSTLMYRCIRANAEPLGAYQNDESRKR